ncbi:MAG: putative ATP-dependent helicase [Pseudomonadota bacterium]
MSPLKALFAEGGVLAQAAPHYRHRAGQLALAEAIERTLNDRSQLVAEAGTGVGKTFAYLVPLFLRHGKAVVSTATRHLQDQLYERDVPRLKAALGVSIQVAVLKGRSNYLCNYRLEQHQDSGRFQRREDIAAFSEIVRFAASTTTGDIAECTAVPEDSPVWSAATSTRENCLGQNCPRFGDCHVLAARKRALDADIIVVNHHLLCADMALREEGFGELLPTAESIVIDEAHALPEIATQFFGQSVSTSSIGLLTRDVLAAGLTHARDGASWPDLCGGVERAVAECRLLAPQPQGLRLRWEVLSAVERERWESRLSDVLSALLALDSALEINAERHPDLAQAHSRAHDLMKRLDGFLAHDDTQPVVRWIDGARQGMTFHVTPYDIRERFGEELRRHARAWVFVSATLAIAGQFRHFQERLGLEEAETLVAASPFDFSRQGLLFVPDDAPDPKASDLIVQLLNRTDIAQLFETVRGGVFVLCTSHRAVGLARDWFVGWAARHTDRLLLVQGDGPRHQLIDRFRGHGRAVLIGSHSFWEGVDVPGDALSMVLIDKLPFAPPDDPVLEARAKALERQGRDAFSSLQVPEAAILLKQGIDRLIRSETDRGLVVVGDKRLADTAYGRRMLRSLPEFSRTRDAQQALAWMGAATGVLP